MFGDIAHRYDLLNHVLTLNIDRRWRRIAVDRLLEGMPARGRYLDACAGTLDLAVEVAGREGFAGRVVASDFSWPMLQAGRHKVKALPVRETCADTLRLPHPDGAFDGAIVGFGARNFADLGAGLRELARVIRPGGRLVVLELSSPAWPPLRRVYEVYFTRVLPWIGARLSPRASAYRYLPESALAFPQRDDLLARMAAAGLGGGRWRDLTCGIVVLYTAAKEEGA